MITRNNEPVQIAIIKSPYKPAADNLTLLAVSLSDGEIS